MPIRYLKDRAMKNLLPSRLILLASLGIGGKEDEKKAKAPIGEIHLFATVARLQAAELSRTEFAEREVARAHGARGASHGTSTGSGLPASSSPVASRMLTPRFSACRSASSAAATCTCN